MAEAAAVITWLYALGFGAPTFYVARHLETTGRLPMFRDWFEMYGGPWHRRYDDRGFIRRLRAFFLTTVVESAFAATLLYDLRLGAVLALVWLPVEAAFWHGFALPIPWLLGATRAALIVAALATL